MMIQQEAGEAEAEAVAHGVMTRNSKERCFEVAETSDLKTWQIVQPVAALTKILVVEW